MKLRSLLAVALAVVVSAQNEDNSYYGLPLGSLHHSNSQTSADVYAADPKTLVITNFVHRPQRGCTTLMAGPKRSSVPEDFPSPSGDGILLPVSKVLGKAPARRFKRNSLAASAFFNWPEQFAALRSGPQATGGSPLPRNAFAGISLSSKSKSKSEEVIQIPETTTRRPRATTQPSKYGTGRPADLSIPWRSYRRPKGSASSSGSTRGTTRTTTRRTGGSTLRRITTKAPNSDSIIVFNEDDDETTQAATTTTTQRPRPTTRVYSFKPVEQTTRGGQPIAGDVRPIVPVAARSRSSSRTTTSSRRTTASPRSKSREHLAVLSSSQEIVAAERDIGRGILVADPNGEIKAPTNVHPNFYGPLPRTPIVFGADTTVQSSEETETTEDSGLVGDIESDGGYTAVFGFEPPVTTGRPRFAPRGAAPPAFGAPSARGGGLRETGGGVVFMLGETSHEVVRTTEAPAGPTGRTPRGRKPYNSWTTTTRGPEDDRAAEEEEEFVTDPTPDPCEGKAWCVVKDPRAERRGSRVTLPPEFYHEATTPSLPDNAADFRLSDMSGETVVVKFPRNADINEYEWFGVYDHCLDTRTAFVVTRDVTPPKETYVDGISGYDHGVNSGPIQIMNCNTLVLTDFSYQPKNNEANAIIVVGIGDYPRKVVQQTRAFIVGEDNEKPLRAFKNEDVTIRLPVGWKTFDINFISIFNPAPSRRVSYGHSVIPPVIVPPCEDGMIDGA